MEGVEGKQCTCRALCRESHDHFYEAPEKNYFYDVYEQKFWGAPVDQVTRALVGIWGNGVCAASENSCQPLPTPAGPLESYDISHGDNGNHPIQWVYILCQAQS